MSDEPEAAVLEPEYIAPPPRGAAQDHAVATVQQGQGGIMPATAQEAALIANELATVKLQAELARSFPRHYETVEVGVHQALQNYDFAESAIYDFKIGTSKIVGASVKLAKEMGRRWGNLKWGFRVTEDASDSRTVKCFAWDLETNAFNEMDIAFRKAVPRRVKEGNVSKTIWREPDERELLMLTNDRAARGVRNMVLDLIPDTLRRNAISWAIQSIARGIREDPEKARRNILIAFSKRGIKPDEIDKYLGCPIKQANDEQLKALLLIGNRLKEGEATWEEIVAGKGAAKAPPSGPEELKKAVAEGAAAVKDKHKGGQA